MIKIPFENGAKSKNAYVTIDGTNHDVTDAVYTGETPLSAENLNQMQENIEKSVVSVSSTEPTTSEKVWFKKGKNLIDYSKLTWWRDINDKGVITYYDDRTVLADYTPVNPNTSYIFSHALGTPQGKIYIFDKNKNYLGYINHDNITSAFTTNENTYYVRVWVWYSVGTITPEIETWMQLEQGTVATNYEEYVENKILVKNANGDFEKFSDTVSVDSKEPNTGVWFRKTKNLFNYKTAEYLNLYIDGATLTLKKSATEIHNTAYIRCKPNTTYTFSKQAGKSFRIGTSTNKPTAGVIVNQTQANHSATTQTITTGENDNFLIFTCFSDYDDQTITYLQMYSTVQVELGTTSSAYENHVEDKILIKNANGNYEKFSETVSVDSKEPNTGVWFKKSKNYLNFINETMTSNGLTTVISGNKATISGTTTLNWAGLQNYNYINLQPGKYTFSVKTDLLATYVVAVKYVDGTTAQQGLVTSATKKSMVLDFAKEVAQFRVNLDGMTSGTAISSEVEFQLEAGEVATDIEEAFEPEIMVKNTNGVFEEFIKKQETKYISNENGNAIKFPDGTLIQYGSYVVPEIQASSGYNKSVVLPVNFSDMNYVLTVTKMSGGALGFADVSDATARDSISQISFVHWNVATGPANSFTAGWTAIGRWK